MECLGPLGHVSAEPAIDPPEVKRCSVCDKPLNDELICAACAAREEALK